MHQDFGAPSFFVRELGCVRGGRRVFSGVSFVLESGEGMLLTGPNGAGKTSLLRLLAGLSAPAEGEIVFRTGEGEDRAPSPQPSPHRGEGAMRGDRSHVEHLSNARNGFEVNEGSPTVPSPQRGEGKGEGASNDDSVRDLPPSLLHEGGGSPDTDRGDDTPLTERSHFVGHLNAVKAALSVAENARFAARYLGGDETRVPEALERLGLAHLADLPAGILSAGQKRRLGLTRLVTVPRTLWLLDEPTVSLDAANIGVLADLIRTHIENGGMAVIATHAALGIELSRHLELGARA